MKSNVPNNILNITDRNVIADIEAYARFLFINGQEADFQLRTALIIQYFSIGSSEKYKGEFYQLTLKKIKNVRIFELVSNLLSKEESCLALIEEYYMTPAKAPKRQIIINDLAIYVNQLFEKLEVYQKLGRICGDANTIFKDCMMIVLHRQAETHLLSYPAIRESLESDKKAWQPYTGGFFQFQDRNFLGYDASHLRSIKNAKLSIGAGPRCNREVVKLLDNTIYNPTGSISHIIATGEGDSLVCEEESKKMDHFDFINYFAFEKGSEKEFGPYTITVKEITADWKEALSPISETEKQLGDKRFICAVLTIKTAGKLPRELTVHFFRSQESQASFLTGAAEKELQKLYVLMKNKTPLLVHSSGGEGRAAYFVTLMLFASELEFLYVKDARYAAHQCVSLVESCRQDRPGFLWTPIQLILAIRRAVHLRIDCDPDFLKKIEKIFRHQSAILHSSSSFLKKITATPASIKIPKYADPIVRVKSGLT